ncbi:MAG: nucleotidyltransferase [Akkermansiaceae bacterium]
MNSDFKDLLRTFNEEQVEYLIVGAYAVIHYTQPRYTKDIDFWLKPSVANAERIARAFHRFGIPLIEVSQSDFESEGLQYVIGAPPCQVDFLTSLPSVPDFDKAWEQRSTQNVDGIPVHYLGRDDLITAKKSAARPQDISDLDELDRADS